MIESFMLEANETVATHFEAHGLPFIYRIHEQPKADRLQRFIDFAATFGMQIEGTSNGIDQKVLQAFMKKIKGQRLKVLVNYVVTEYAASSLFRKQ